MVALITTTIYLIRCLATDFYKIGIASDLAHRLSSMQSGNPHKLEVVLSSRCGDRKSAYEKEQKIIKNLARFHVHGEWFELGPSEIQKMKVILGRENITVCFECGKSAMYEHYVIPQSRGGTKTISLCPACYTKTGVQKPLDTNFKEHERASRGIPYGWYRVADNAPLIPHKDEQEIIRAARDLRDSGLSLPKIGVRLKDLKMVPRSGKNWHAENVKNLFRADLAHE